MEILQTLDIKDNCVGIYSNDVFTFSPKEEDLKKFNIAWKHSPLLDDERYTYLYLLCKENNLATFLSDPDSLKDVVRTLEAHKKAAALSKVELDKVCFYDLIPDHTLKKYFSLRELAMKNIVKTIIKKSDYSILHKAHVLTENISKQTVDFNNLNRKILYNIFGSATGRLTTKKGSVPVLTLKKEQRKLLKPQNDVFVELDFNAAEIRMLMALSGREQPEGDIHEWVVKNVFNGAIERSRAKVELFAWLYNPSSSKSQFDKIFSREIFRDFYSFENESLTTPFGRVLQVKERKAQNYLLQSTTSDQVVENAYNIQKMLNNTKSTIAFTLHDSIILDMSKKDATMLKEVKRQFEQTRWGPFSSTCKIGRDFGSLKELKI